MYIEDETVASVLLSELVDDKWGSVRVCGVLRNDEECWWWIDVGDPNYGGRSWKEYSSRPGIARPMFIRELMAILQRREVAKTDGIIEPLLEGAL